MILSNLVLPLVRGLRRTASLKAGWGRSPEPLPPLPPNNHMIPITEALMLIRIHATTNTPGALVERLTEAERDAIVEAHAPREGRILRMR